MTLTAPLATTPFRKARRPDERVVVLGRAMDLVRPEEVWDHAARKIAAGKKTLIANHNLHSLYLVRRDPELVRFFEIADLIEVDSTPILAWARLTAKRGRGFHRCTYLDWRDDFWPRAVAEGWRVFYLGGEPGVAASAAQSLAGRYPGIQLETRDGFFDMAPDGPDAASVIAQIKAYDPQVLFVGMGMPRQEAWIVRNYAALGGCAVFSVGAAFDYEAGVQKAAPRWMGRLGAEWAFRLVSDPRRLFQRYLVEPWFLIPAALADLGRAITRPKAPDRRAPEPDRRGDRPRDWIKPGRRGADWRGRPS